MTPALLIFILLGIIAVASALAMLLSRNTVYSALFLILNFLAVAVIYILMGASFVALSQIAVYAGAIMVLVLFVIMLLGTQQLDPRETLKWQRPLAIVLTLALIIQGAYTLVTRYGFQYATLAASPEFVDPKNLGMVLFQKHSLPFEVTSVILLVAAIGAVVLTHKQKKDGGA